MSWQDILFYQPRRKIAELCDKEHRNVLADIRTMCEQLNLDVLTFQHIYLDSMNREQTEYEFVENKDYISFHKKMERVVGGTVRIEYFVSVGMAKELAMVENNDKGSQARKYFIECEKLKQNTKAQEFLIRLVVV